jgi:mannose-6-phosphate isomerase-like protein (cupin superfamily)
VPVGITFGDLLSDEDWIPLLSRDDQSNPNYFWVDGSPLADVPVDFAATFDGSMWMSRKPIEVRSFNRNPLRVRPHFTVPRHHHNLDEMILVFQGAYDIDHGEGPDRATVRVGPGDFFISRAGTPYTMTAGPEGVTYIETWPEPVPTLQTYWHDVGWVT